MKLNKKWKSLRLGIAASLVVASSAAAFAEPLKVGFVYLGPVKDGGWTQMHDQARLKLEKALGDKIKTTFVENVPETANSEVCVSPTCRRRQQTDLRHLVRLHGASAESREAVPEREIRARQRF